MDKLTGRPSTRPLEEYLLASIRGAGRQSEVDEWTSLVIRKVELSKKKKKNFFIFCKNTHTSVCAFKQGRLHSPLKKSAGRSEEVDANGRVCTYTLPRKEETPEFDVEPGAISQEHPNLRLSQELSRIRRN